MLRDRFADVLTDAQVEQIKRDAKRTRRALGITHGEALNRHAAQRGFSSWAALMRITNARRDAAK